MDLLLCGSVLSYPPGGSSAPSKRPLFPLVCSFWDGKPPKVRKTFLPRKIKGQMTFIQKAPTLCQSLPWAPGSCDPVTHIPRRREGLGQAPQAAGGTIYPGSSGSLVQTSRREPCQRDQRSPAAWGSKVRIREPAPGSRTYYFLASCPRQVTNCPQPQVPSGANTLSYGRLRIKAFFHITHPPCATQRARLWDAVSL